MTNFEAWQKTLPESERVEKVEDLIVDRGEECNDPDDDRCVIRHDCRVCPINGKCGRDYWNGCVDVFTAWAKSEAKEDNK